jgi:UDP-N-acetylmuramate--alanine ligase
MVTHALGDGNFFIFEADESDKSFLSFYPDSAVITNIDDDHLEAYEGDINNLKKSFLDFSDNIPFFGYVIANYDDKNTRDVLKIIKRRVITFGLNKKSDIAISEINYFFDYVDFKIHIKDTNKKHKFRLSLQGKIQYLQCCCCYSSCYRGGN